MENNVEVNNIENNGKKKRIGLTLMFIILIVLTVVAGIIEYLVLTKDNNTNDQNNVVNIEDNFTKDKIYNNLSQVLDGTLQNCIVGEKNLSRSNNYACFRTSFEFDGDILSNIDYKLEFAAQYAYYNGNPDTYYKSVIATGDLWISEDSFDEVLKTVYGENVYDRDKYLRYNEDAITAHPSNDTGIRSNPINPGKYYMTFVGRGGYNYSFNETSTTKENDLIIKTADVYEGYDMCMEHMDNERQCNSSRNKLGTIKIEYVETNDGIKFKSIEVHSIKD